jgi:PAS domain S-box-containing protein
MYFIRPNSKIFETLFTKSVDPIAITTRQGGVVQLNPAWHNVLGWTLEELSSESLLHFVHFNDIPSMLRGRDQLERPGTQSIHGELRFLHKHGEWRTLEFNATSFDGHHFTIYRDMTQRFHPDTDNDGHQEKNGCVGHPYHLAQF